MILLVFLPTSESSNHEAIDRQPSVSDRNFDLNVMLVRKLRPKTHDLKTTCLRC